MKSHGPYHLNELFGLFEFHASILDLALNFKKTTKKHPSLQILIIPSGNYTIFNDALLMYLHIKLVDCPLCQIQMPEKLKTLETMTMRHYFTSYITHC